MADKTTFIQAKWAECAEDQLVPFRGPLPLQMKHSDGTALPLVSFQQESFGADVVRFDRGKGVGLHTHIGSHILLVVSGTGTLTYDRDRYTMFPGMIYLIPSHVPHAIYASSELVLIAVGNAHQPADSYERLDLVIEPKAANE